MVAISMRLRLTLWYTGVLALVLIIFAIIAYSQLARAARERTDKSLLDTANSFISNFKSELNDENQPLEIAANDATSSFHFRDRQVIVYDDQKKVLEASDTPEPLRQVSWFTDPLV